MADAARCPWQVEYIRDQFLNPFDKLFGLSEAFVGAWDKSYPLCDSLSI